MGKLTLKFEPSMSVKIKIEKLHIRNSYSFKSWDKSWVLLFFL